MVMSAELTMMKSRYGLLCQCLYALHSRLYHYGVRYYESIGYHYTLTCISVLCIQLFYVQSR